MLGVTNTNDLSRERHLRYSPFAALWQFLLATEFPLDATFAIKELAQIALNIVRMVWWHLRSEVEWKFVCRVCIGMGWSLRWIYSTNDEEYVSGILRNSCFILLLFLTRVCVFLHLAFRKDAYTEEVIYAHHSLVVAAWRYNNPL